MSFLHFVASIPMPTSPPTALDDLEDISLMTILITISVIALGWALGRLYLAIAAYVKRRPHRRRRKHKTSNEDDS